MDYETIIVEKKDHVARITLNRPDRLNALNRRMFRELNAALEDVANDKDMRALVLTGAGRAFCASADINEEREGGDRLLGYMEPNEIYQFIRSGPQGITTETAPNGGAHHRDGQRPGHRRRVRLRAGLRHPGRLRTLDGS